MKPLRKILFLACLPLIAGATTVDVELDVNEQEHPISPMIYGQFIEHLGRCIYGGIWAEMLEDRKFFFPVTETYDPYQALVDTPFPVVGASPWEIVGDVKGLTMVTENSFVGDYTPMLQAGTGIRQHDLALVQGKEYEGYIWAESLSGGVSVVEISIVCEESNREISRLEIGPNGYEQHRFIFTADQSAEKAMFEIRVVSGKCLIGTASLMPGDNVRGMRADTLQLLKELNAPIYRWPGGNFVSGYDWRDGIGDRDRRPPRKNPAWVGVEHNDFGTDEFLDFCHEIGTEPIIAANTGFGDSYSAAQWVEYCNASADTIGGSWRVKNGHKEPYYVKHWCVGNEMWGNWQLGYMHLDQYVLKHNQTAKAMLAVDPTLVLVGSGDINTRSVNLTTEEERGWSEGLLQDCADNMDMISEHFYAGRLPWTEDQREDVLTHVKRIKENIKSITDKHRELQANMPSLKGRVVPISMDEWNYWHRDYVYGELGCIYDLQDALGIAEGLHEYYRQSDIVEMAFYAQTVNVIGCIKTTKTEAEFASTGLVLWLYRSLYGDTPLKLEGDFGDIDIVAALKTNRDLITIGVVNPLSEPVTVHPILKGVKDTGIVSGWWITGDSPESFNTPGKPRQVNFGGKENIELSEGITLPPLSCGVIEIQYQ